MEQVKDIQIFYFHGLNSGEQSSAFKHIKEVFPNTQLLKYNFIVYEKAYKEIESFLRNQTLDNLNTVFIGSGLGGYWANLFCSVFGIQTILINPSLRPRKNLLKYTNEDFICEARAYLFTAEPAKAYKEHPIRIYPRAVFIGLLDNVVNYHETEKVLGNIAKFIYLPDEGHRLKNLQPVLDMIPRLVNTFL
ncbi:MAG: hypothetical protein IPP77_10880 [Bacteroidetes bacterium]|nr:hypothetical protein [Bacteroidota bacterium]